jgi:hypothetical protein
MWQRWRQKNCERAQQTAKNSTWTNRAPYFHLVFTLPPAAAEIALQNERLAHAVLMRVAAETTVTLAENPRRLGAGSSSAPRASS